MKALQPELTEINAALDEHAIVAITDLQGRITFVNDKFCAISQYSRDELLGQDHRILNSGHHSSEFMRELWTTIQRGKVWQGEIKNKAKDGTCYWVATTIAPSLDKQGMPRQYVSIRTDISRRKQAEEDLEKLNVSLEQRVLDRTAEVEAFSYSVAHDLRSPLCSVAAYSEMILQDFGPAMPAEARRQLELIQGAGKRMQALIEDLLTFAGINRRRVNLQPVDTAALVNSVWAELDPSGSPRTVEFHLGPLPACSADPSLLRQIWMNLLSNALKYTAKREKAIIDVGCASVGGVDTFFVRDNGAGFDMRRAGKLFEPFERLHRSDEYAGTGVGLAIVRRIVSRHGGLVWAEAAVDRGATFYFTLPS